MINSISIVKFENQVFQENFKILKIEGKLQNNVDKTCEKSRFIYTVETIFANELFKFTIRYLNLDEISNVPYERHTKVQLLIENTQSSLKIFLAVVLLEQLKNTEPSPIFKYIDSLNADELNILIFDSVHSYFKETDKFKLTSIFYK